MSGSVPHNLIITLFRVIVPLEAMSPLFVVLVMLEAARLAKTAVTTE